MIVSVDRAVRHYADEIGVDFDAVQEYYEGLPHKNKKLLQDCGIHFSALVSFDGPVLIRGLHLSNPENSKEIDPQAPPANILIFLGSIARNGFNGLDKTLKHELIHFAQENSREQKTNEQERLLQVKLALKRGKIAKAFWLAKAAIYGGVFEGITSIAGDAPDIKIVAGYGLAAAALGSFIHRKKKRESIYELQKELHVLRTSSEIEKEAESLSDDGASLITLKPRQIDTPILTRNRRRAASNRLTDYAHRKLSLNPPQPLETGE